MKPYKRRKSDEIRNLSIFNLYFLAKFCKKGLGDLQKTLMCGFKDSFTSIKRRNKYVSALNIDKPY